MKLFSFVIPCYRSEDTIEKVVDEIIATVNQRAEVDYEIICVNDCSPDNVLDVLKRVSANNKKIKVINLAKNMGKHCAMLAGYSVVKGDYVVNVDDDFQCPICDLWKLFEPIEFGNADVVTANYEIKRERLWKRIGSDLNLKISEMMLEKPKGLRFENFSIVKRFVAEEVINYKNPYPYYEGLVVRCTRNIETVTLEQRERADGKDSGFTLRRSISLFLNGFTSFSVKPLEVASILGILFAMIGFVYGIYTVIHKLINADVMVGYSSLLAVILLSSGLIMIMLGIIGEYIGRIFISINNSPQYIIKETINIDE